MGNGATKKEKKQKTYLLQTCEEHEGSINCMDLSEDGSVLATGSDDSNIRLWSTKTDMVECIGILEGHEDYITCVLIEENFVLSSSADKTIRKWDMSTCDCMLVFLGHDSTVNKLICTGDFLFSCSYDKKARCWDFDTGECVRVFSGHKNNITSILFIPAEKDNLSDAMKFIQTQAERKNLQSSLTNGNKLTPLSFNAISVNNNKTPNFKNNNEDDEDEIYSKDLIITGSLDSLAKSWSFETGECVQTFKGHSSAITCLATDPFGKLLFTGSSDHTIRSWEIMTGQLLKIFTGHQTTILSLLAHRKLLYSTSSDHTARCWVMEFGDCTRIYKEHTHSVSTIIENNGLVYTGCGDGIARCFDAKSGALKRSFKGHTGAINCLRIVSNRLFTGSYDGSLRIWDATELSSEKSSIPENRTRKQENVRVNTKSAKLTIENEKDLNESRSNNHSRNTYDQRSEIDSGYDERDYRYSQTIRKFDVKEIV